MNKVYTLIICIMIMTISPSLSAQNKAGGFKQGTFQFGGSFTVEQARYDKALNYSDGFNEYEEEREVENTTVTFSPMFGYFVKDNVMLFGALNITKDETTTKQEGSDDSTSDDDITTIELGLRYYIPSGNMAFYMGGSVGVHEEMFFGMADQDGKFFSLHAGVLFMVTPHIGIDGGVRLTYTSADIEGEDVDITTLTMGYLGVQTFF